MAALSFGKDSEERQMFIDLWDFCQKYWIVEDNDEYWAELIKAADEFAEKHPNGLGEMWLTIFMQVKEAEFKEMKGDKARC